MSREYDKDVYTCFVHIEKAYNRVLVKALGSVAEVRCWRPPVTGRQVTVFLLKSLCPCRGVKSQPFTFSVGLRQGCVLSPHLFIVYRNLIDSHSRVEDCVTVGSCRIIRLLFADDLVLLASSQQDLQHALDRFSAACDRAGMKISTKKTEELCLSRNQGSVRSKHGRPQKFFQGWATSTFCL